MKCINCKKEIFDNKILVKIGKKNFSVCSEKCKKDIDTFLKKENKWKNIIILLVMLLIIMPIILYIVTKNEAFITIMLIGMGSIMFFFPIPTHQTIILFGLKKSKIIVRVIAIIILLRILYKTVF